MSIHENLGNLPESKEPEKSVDKSCDNIEIVMEPLDEKVEKPKGIHAASSRCRYLSQRKFIAAATHRKNMMKYAINHNNNKNNNTKECLQSMIKAGKQNHYREDINKKLDRLRRTVEPHKMGKPQQKSFGLQNSVKSNTTTELKKLQETRLNLWQDNGQYNPLNATEYIEFKINEVIKKEEPKSGLNLSEIVSKISYEVASGKITNVEDVIGKLRLAYEDNSKFTNANKKYVSWLNFEDDTCKPVLKISNEKMAIINKWYNECNLILDVEDTNVSIPESIPVQDLSGILFNEINCKYKDEYLNNYLPMVINNLISNYNIKNFEKKFFTKDNGLSYGMVNQVLQYSLSGSSAAAFSSGSSSSATNYTNIYSSLGVNIPDNLSGIVHSDAKINNIGLPAAVGTYKVSNPGLRSEPDLPQIGTTYHINSSGIHGANTSTCENVDSYNTFKNVTSKPLEDNDNKSKLIYHSYNEDYNALDPEFASNVLNLETLGIVNNVEVQKKFTNIVVILNTKFLQTLFILNPESLDTNILNNNTEFGFIKLFSINTLNNDVIKFISNEFNKAQFDNVDELNQKLQVTSQYIDFSLKHTPETDATTEESIVKKYIQSSFTIDNDINNKMKASVLHDTIVNSKVVTIEKSRLNGFKNRLSTYLKNLGLEKKRYNDGYYYYGIKPKKAFSENARPNITYEEYILERNKPFEKPNTDCDDYMMLPHKFVKEHYDKIYNNGNNIKLKNEEFKKLGTSTPFVDFPINNI